MQVPGFGVRMARVILKQSGVENAADLFKMSLPDILKVDGIGKERARNLVQFDDWTRVDRMLEKTSKSGAELVALTDPDYPQLLKQTFDPPVLLWVKGNPKSLNRQGIAVVGTRNPGSYGMKQAGKWSRELCKVGLSINSGLAYGVDSIAHKTAVEMGSVTVAVMGSGIDWIYPEKNRKLADRIIDSGGAVVTEYPPGTKPDAPNFPERNRIVSGMSHGVLVVESGIKGGSMITARLALDQNREVFVVPHPLPSLSGEGCNYLIKTGQGKLIQTMDDLLCELSVETGVSVINDAHEKTPSQNSLRWREEELDDEQKQLCRKLEEKSLHIDQLAESLDTQPFKLSPMLLELEMKGLIRQKAGKYFELK